MYFFLFIYLFFGLESRKSTIVNVFIVCLFRKSVCYQSSYSYNAKVYVLLKHALFRGLLELFFQMKHLHSLNFFLLPYVLKEITLKVRVGICQERVDFLC